MGFLKVIRTWALRDKMPIREIARRTSALTLSKEPEANVARYDGLRTQKGTRHAS